MNKTIQNAVKAAIIICIAILILTQALHYKPRPTKTLTTTTEQSITVDHKEPVVKRLVVASLKADDTTWLQKRLPDWAVSRYVVDDLNSPLTVPLNKGRESMVYLTYIIDNYDTLADINVFIHSLQYQWHNDDPNKDGATVISRLQLPHIRQQGYVNMRCAWTLGCPAEIRLDDPSDNRETTSHFRQAFQELFPERADNIPTNVGASCCAQFAVTAAKLREKPKAEYERIRNWVRDTPLADDVSGRIMEYSWHMFFGMPDVHCPDARTCYCAVFGLCDLQNCAQWGCPTQYQLPPFSTMPEGWKQLAEYDNI
ncbi:uncharacterized protein AB675_6365 [Cyphellophora attinorum]|uniref:Uncharacterized protein n=1 Tax=Cyphellophora attinorum TaxID=1664694 RepID=A0A0N0NQA7_9EURO|nr:uncharacterized protein AB675_6365 [Phialophora attinorum]KPI43688.1 hypothetical protein AB675_6365 [Phialophora attinorum]